MAIDNAYVLAELRTRLGVLTGNYGTDPNSSSAPEILAAPAGKTLLENTGTSPRSFWFKGSNGTFYNMGTGGEPSPGGGGLQGTPWNIEADAAPPGMEAGFMYEVAGSGEYDNGGGWWERFEDKDVALVLLDGSTIVNLTKRNVSDVEVTATAWDPASKDPSITLSGDNLQAVSSSYGLISASTEMVGQKIFELKSVSGGLLVGGVINIDADTTSTANIGTSVGVVAIYSGYGATFQIFNMGATSSVTASNPPGVISANDVMGVTYNSSTREVEFYYNGTKMLLSAPVIMPGSSAMKPLGYIFSAPVLANFGATSFNYPVSSYTGLSNETVEFRGTLTIRSVNWNPNDGYPSDPNVQPGDAYRAAVPGTIGDKNFPSGSMVWWDGINWRTLDEYIPGLPGMVYLGEFPPPALVYANTPPPYRENGVYRIIDNCKWKEAPNTDYTNAWRTVARGSLIICLNGTYKLLAVTDNVYGKSYNWGYQPHIRPDIAGQPDLKSTGISAEGIFEFRLRDLRFLTLDTTEFVFGIYLPGPPDMGDFYEPRGPGVGAGSIWVDLVSKTVQRSDSHGGSYTIASWTGDNAINDIFTFYCFAGSGNLICRVYRNGARISGYSAVTVGTDANGYVKGYTPFANIYDDGDPISTESVTLSVEYNTGKVPFSFIPDLSSSGLFIFDMYVISLQGLQPALLSYISMSAASQGADPNAAGAYVDAIPPNTDTGGFSIGGSNNGSISVNDSVVGGASALVQMLIQYEDGFYAPARQYLQLESKQVPAVGDDTARAAGGIIFASTVDDARAIKNRVSFYNTNTMNVINGGMDPADDAIGADGDYGITSTYKIYGPKKAGSWTYLMGFKTTWNTLFLDYSEGGRVVEVTAPPGSGTGYVIQGDLETVKQSDLGSGKTVAFKIRNADFDGSPFFELRIDGGAHISFYRHADGTVNLQYGVLGTTYDSFSVPYADDEEWLMCISTDELVIVDPTDTQHVYSIDSSSIDPDTTYGMQLGGNPGDIFEILRLGDTSLTIPAGYENEFAASAPEIMDVSVPVNGVVVSLVDQGSRIIVQNSQLDTTEVGSGFDEVGGTAKFFASLTASTRVLTVYDYFGAIYLSAMAVDGRWPIKPFIYSAFYRDADSGYTGPTRDYGVYWHSANLVGDTPSPYGAGYPLLERKDPSFPTLQDGQGVKITESGWIDDTYQADEGDLFVNLNGAIVKAEKQPKAATTEVILDALPVDIATERFQLKRPYGDFSGRYNGNDDIWVEVVGNSHRPKGGVYRFVQSGTGRITVSLKNGAAGYPTDGANWDGPLPADSKVQTSAPGDVIELRVTRGDPYSGETWGWQIVQGAAASAEASFTMALIFG